MTTALIGTGHLLEALLVGALRSGVPADDLVCSTRREERAAELAARHGVRALTSNADAVVGADVVVVGSSPGSLFDVVEEIRSSLAPDAVVAVATVPATLAELERSLPGVAVARIMPSVAARVGHGICGVARGSRVGDAAWACLTAHLSRSSEVIETDEPGLDRIGSLAGSGPAYVAALARSLADGGVRLGMGPAEALRLAVLTLGGTTALLQDGASPEEVQRAVGHPGGSTVRSLEHLGASGALDAVTAAVTHSFEPA